MATSDEKLGRRKNSWDEYMDSSGFIGKLLIERTSGEEPSRHAIVNLSGRVLLILETGDHIEEWDVTANATA